MKFALDFTTSALVALAVLCAAPVAQAAGGYKLTSGVTYDTVGGISLKMDLYQPAGSAAHPGVIVIHGGCFNSGDRSYMTGYAVKLAAAGFVVANVDYRLAPTYVYPAAKLDVEQALRWMRRNATAIHLDTTRIASYGWSAGGTLALYLGLEDAPTRAGTYDAYSGKVAAVVSSSARTDFTNDTGGTDCAEVFLGKTRSSATMAAFRAASPLYMLDAGDAAFYLHHGTADTTVLPLHSRLFYAKAAGLGLDTFLFEGEGLQHGMGPEVRMLLGNLLKRKFGMIAGNW